MNVSPATNIQVAAVAAFLSATIEHICKAHGFTMTDDMSAALPAAVAVAVAHLWDLATGGNTKAEALPQTVREMKMQADNPMQQAQKPNPSP